MFLESRALCLTLEVVQFLESVHVKCVKMYVECVKIYVIGVKMYVAILRKCEIPGKLTLTFDLDVLR